MNPLGRTWSFFRKHPYWAVLAVFAVAGGGYFWYRQSNSAANQSASIRTSTVERTDLRVSVTGSGQVYAREEVALKAPAAGDAIEVTGVSVKNDQKVKKGDLIATLDASDAVKAVRDAELSLRSAEIKMKQTKNLYDNETEDDKLNRQNQEISVTEARNRLADAREDLADYRIEAPFDGIVTGLSVAAGDSVSRDDAIASVITEELYAKVSLNEVDAAGVETGDSATLTFDALDGATTVGTVSKIDTIGTVSQNVVTYNTEIAFDSSLLERLKPGMSVDVEIVTAEKTDVVAVPIAAVRTSSSGSSVTILDSDGSTRNVNVETGLSTDTSIEIVSGLSVGQEVVLKSSSSSSSSSSGQSASSFMQVGGPGAGGPPGM
ncbi:MAG: efflux RND transporter periplasmic adaptor subunit [Candidatus Moranbacteria bacterium]|nr:efflux RND transporter periplasmic adaptor subunit [Candidatus Moranbacteria bacterium]